MATPHCPELIARRPEPVKSAPANRWAIALAGVIMQIALGTVYAWSVFRIPLTKAFGWTISQVTFTFTLAILMLGFAAFAGGLWMRKSAQEGSPSPLECFMAPVFSSPASQQGICIGSTSPMDF